MTEAQLVSRILGALNGVPKTFAFKIVAAPYARKGISDILCVSDGRFLAFEVKLPGKEKTLTVHQSAFMDMVKRAGGRSFMVNSVVNAMYCLTNTILDDVTQNVQAASEQPAKAIRDDQGCRLTLPVGLYDRPIGPHD
jgi:penicillin-binding protein-related factor A (putative recombinase)